MTTIAIACDHAGVELKTTIIEHLQAKQFEVINLGTDSTDSVDYPDYAYKVTNAVSSGEADKGILLCGTGVGISIAANRNPSIRAALCYNSEVAKLARQHNDANVIVLGARMLDQTTILESIEVFLSTEFEGGRHQRRIDKMS